MELDRCDRDSFNGISSLRDRVSKAWHHPTGRPLRASQIGAKRGFFAPAEIGTE
jgi:hypothetical protein